MADSRETLFSDFSPVTTQDWMDKIKVDLKGADYDKKLVWRTPEGFNVKPFYRKEDLDALKTVYGLPGRFPFVRGNKEKDNGWLVRQDISVNDPEKANAWAIDVLNKGVDSLGFCIQEENICADFLNALLDGICCDCIELNFIVSSEQVLDFSKLLIDYFVEKGYDADCIRGSINYDPLGNMLTTGEDLSDFIEIAYDLVLLFAPYPYFRCIGVNSVMLNNAGAYIYQELGYALAWGNEYLEQLVGKGISVSVVASKIKFNFGIGSNYFMEMAKFRSGRMLWANIVKEYIHQEGSSGDGDACSECSCKMAVHAETSTFNMTLYDSYVNMLRSQTEAMSAVLGGVDSLTVLPFDRPYKTSDNFSERIARNQQLLLKEESHFDKVVDPAGGSYYIEQLTVSIAEQAWQLFLDVDEKGGMLQSIQHSSVQTAINNSNKARHEAVSRRKEILLGTNQYPNFGEMFTESLLPDSNNSKGTFCQTINQQRAATEFEKLRLYTEQSAKRPKAFMLTIGNLAMRQARAQFSCNFLACGGYEVIDNLGFSSVEEGVNAAMNSNADIIVLCSSDEEYAEYAIPAFEYINGRAMFIVAGAPACMETLKMAGIENFIHVRCNVLETLLELNHKLGIC